MADPLEPALGRSSAAFALAAAIAVVMNTALACIKDAHKPLDKFMASLTGSSWTTQGLADILLFVFLGALLSSIDLPAMIGSRRLVSILAGAAVIAGAGLAGWYILY